MIGERSSSYEREFLEQAARTAGLAPSAAQEFIDAVWRRLDKGEREYGDTALKRPPRELTLEAKEEAEDIAGWSLMRAQSRDALPEGEAQFRLHRIVSLAVSLWLEIQDFVEVEDEAASTPKNVPTKRFSHFYEE